MKSRLKIYFSYDGTNYHGFQRQKNVSNTIQETLEKAFSRIFNYPLHLLASGRTDAGVHARIQVGHVDIPTVSLKRISYKRIILGLNSLLPKDIRVWKLESTAQQFHAVSNATQKLYLYFIDPSIIQCPIYRFYAWHLRLPLNWNLMQQAANDFVGTHDFQAFCASGAHVKTTIRTVYEACWKEVNLIPGTTFKVFRISGNGFLKQMVRSIVGTLVKIGSHRMDPEMLKKALATGDRKLIGPTAPAHGLWLWDVQYK